MKLRGKYSAELKQDPEWLYLEVGSQYRLYLVPYRADQAWALLFFFMQGVSELEADFYSEWESVRIYDLFMAYGYEDDPYPYYHPTDALPAQLVSEYYEYLEALRTIPSEWHSLLWEIMIGGTRVSEAIETVSALQSGS